MLSARTVIIAVVLILVLSLLGTVVSMLGPPDQNGLGADSYGTRAYGYRALYDILRALGANEERGLAPPGGSLDRSATLLLWAPDEELVENEPVYLENVAAWVRQGGRAIIGLEIAAARARRPERLLKMNFADRTLTEVLGLKDVGVRLVDVLVPPSAPKATGKPESDVEVVADEDESEPSPDADEDSDPTPSPRFHSGSRRVPAEHGSLDESMRELMMPELFAVVEVEAHGEGDLSALLADVKRLRIPRELQTLVVGDGKPVGTLSVRSEGQSWTVAAQYKLGEGELILLSDPAIFDNRLISRSDNPVLAVRLLDAGRGPIVWDEFYHGLTIRGSMLFLLTRGSYALVAGMILLTTIAWLWRQSRYLGPPLSAAPVSRRSVREYVEAMARFFQRGAESRRFMLEEVRQGVLWSLRRKTGAQRGREAWARPVAVAAHAQGSLQMPTVADQPGTGQPPALGVQRPATGDRESLEAIVAALVRHDPAAGLRLRKAVEQADLILSDSRKVRDREILEAVKGLADCL